MSKVGFLGIHGLLGATGLSKGIDIVARNCQAIEGFSVEVVEEGLNAYENLDANYQKCLAILGAQKKLMLCTHSMGSDEAFKIINRLAKETDCAVDYAAIIDATGWGNASWSGFGGAPGQWIVEDGALFIDYWRQPLPPGGGRASLASGNTDTILNCFDRTEPHVGIDRAPAVIQRITLHAKKLAQS